MGRLSASLQTVLGPSRGVSQDRAARQAASNQVQRPTNSDPSGGLGQGSAAQAELPTTTLSERTPQAPPVQQQSSGPSASDNAILRAEQAAASASPESLLGSDNEQGGPDPQADPQAAAQDEASRLQAEEAARRARPTWEGIQGNLQNARETAEAGVTTEVYTDKYNIDNEVDSLFGNDLSSPDSEPVISDIGDVQSPFKFDIQSNKINNIIQEEATRPEFEVPARKLGIIRDDGTLDKEAGSQLMYAMSAQVARRGFSLERDLENIQKEFNDALQNKTENKLDSKKRNAEQRRDERELFANAKPEFDNFSAPREALELFEELRSPPQEGAPTDVPRPRPSFNLSDTEKTDFMNTVLSRMAESDIGMFTATEYKDPLSEKTYRGFQATPEMYNVLGGITNELRHINVVYNKDVSFTPNKLGLPTNDAALLHNQGGRTTGDVKLHGKGGVPTVSKAIEYLGSNANKVLDRALAGQIMQMEEIWANANEQPAGSLKSVVGISDHPSASLFQKDTTSFMKRIPNNTQWQSFDALNQKFESVKQDPVALTQFMDNFIYPAKSLFDGAQAGYLQEVYDASRVRGRKFYYPQTLQGQSGRVMDDSVLNMMRSKKARGLVSSARDFLVSGRTLKDIIAGKNEPTDRYSKNFEAIVARNLGHKADQAPGVENLRAIFKQNVGKWGLAAEYLLSITPDINALDSMTSQLNTFVQEQKANGVARKEIRPDSKRLRGKFPTTGRAIAKDSDPWVRTITTYNLGVPQTRQEQTPYTHKEMRDLVAQVLELKKSNGEPAGKVDEADINFNTLLNLGKYLEGKPFHANVVSEVDGKNSSFAITSMQQGDQELASYSGILWNPTSVLDFDEDGNAFMEGAEIISDDFESLSEFALRDPSSSVIPIGDIRDFIHLGITPIAGDGGASVLDSVVTDPEERMKWRKVYSLVSKFNRRKELHKVPAMTTGYGKDASSHGDSVRKLLESDTDLKRAIFSALSLDITNASEVNTVISEMARIEEAALHNRLGTNIKQTGVLKLIGNAAAIIGSNVYMVSPSGYPMYMAASSSRLVGTPESRKTTKGTGYDVANFEFVTDPSKRVYGDYKERADAKAGKKNLPFKMENRIGVNSIHGVDASIVHSTAADVYDLNQSRTNDQGPLWFRQVYDAFIVDIDSFDTVVDLANKNFVKNNMEWNIFTEGKAALERVYKDLFSIAHEAKRTGKVFDVSPEGEYKEFYQVLMNLGFISNTSNKRGFVDFDLTKEQISIIQRNLREIGFERGKGVQMDPDQFIFAFKHIFLTATGIVPTLNQYERNANNKKRTLLDKVIKQTKNYYGDSASPYASVKQYG